MCGKCNICAWLSDIRQRFFDSYSSELIRYFHGLHRSTYMAERIAYGERRSDAENDPDRLVNLFF